MTKAQFMKKCKVLKKDISETIDSKIEKALKSGAIDLKDYENDFVLPKIVISAIIGGMENEYKPFGDEENETVKNLKLFI